MSENIQPTIDAIDAIISEYNFDQALYMFPILEIVVDLQGQIETLQGRPTMNHFIELPDGTIVNVAHVREVWRGDHPWRELDDGSPQKVTFISTGDEPSFYADPARELYAYFQSIAKKIGEGD